MTRMPDLDVYLLPVDIGWNDLRRMAITAEALGFHTAWIHDNVVGPVPWKPQAASYDAWSVLGALGEATSRIRLGPLVTPMGRRHPSVFAKMTASFDNTSGGRLDLGMGPGDEPHQYEPWGLPFPVPRERIAILEEEIEIIKALWTQESVTYDGRRFRLEDAGLAPKPIQRPHPPIWIGLVFGRKIMPRVAARHADGINFYAKADDDVRATIEQVQELCADRGRDPANLRFSRCVSVWVTDEKFDVAAELRRLSRIYGTGLAYLEDYVANYERMVVGPPELIAEELVAQAELGIDQVIFNSILGPGPAYSDRPWVEGILDSWTRIAQEVKPLMQSLLI